MKNFTWEDALHEARKYHREKMYSRSWYGVDYDEDNKIFDAFPELVKDALWYLCENGEFD